MCVEDLSPHQTVPVSLKLTELESFLCFVTFAVAAIMAKVSVCTLLEKISLRNTSLIINTISPPSGVSSKTLSLVFLL